MSQLTCPFTMLPLTNYDPLRYKHPFVKCSVKLDEYTYLDYTIDRAAFDEWNKDLWFSRNRHLIATAWRKGLSLFSSNDLITLDLVKQRVNSSSIPHTPKMKLDFLLKYIDDNTPSQGKALEIISEVPSNSSVSQWQVPFADLYFKDQDEFVFYVNTLENSNLINFRSVPNSYNLSSSTKKLALTYEGLNYLSELETEGHLSKNCFVAMSFDPSRQLYREAIETAIHNAGYQPVLIDTRHIDSDKTINDRIIAEVRACKFCVADFTGQRNGVYFEAGFALGLGKPIIYACEYNDFKENSHFDLKPFQHILYNDVQELGEQLKAKIDAWIQ
jgi:nucleoside 2-deoxyribosyltransferase